MNSPKLLTLRPLFAALLVIGLVQLSPPACSLEHGPVGVADAASPLPLAQPYSFSATNRHEVAHYLVSEKLDGVRAYWDGSNLRFRSGRLIHAPAWFTAPLPAHPLDGELWMQRQSFERLSAAVRRQEPQDEEWKRISYQVYELPQGQGSFSDRLAVLRESVARVGVPWLQVLTQTTVPDQAALRVKLAQIVRDGGEGLMLHRADAPWQTGRTDVLLKVKPYQDAEATVVAYEAGRGKFEGKLGALIVMTPEGRRFRLGSGLSDALRLAPPAIGTTVTYRYRDLTSSGLPRFASFLRVREDE